MKRKLFLFATMAVAITFGQNAQERVQVITDLNESAEVKTRPQKVITRIEMRDGVVEFVEQPDGSVGIGLIGESVIKKVNGLLDDQKATALEVFQALGGTNPPELLTTDHKMQSRFRQSKSAVVATPALQPGEAPPGGSGWFVDGAGGTCGTASDSANFSYWTTWFKGAGPYVGEKYHLWGAHDIWDTGQHVGNAKIVLGPTSAGVVVMCDADGKNFPDATVRVEEEFKLSNGGSFWVQIWNPGFIFEGMAYGYRFKGYTLRRIRMSISNFAGGTFFWGGSY